MLSALMVAFNPFKFIAGPAAVIIFAAALILLLKLPKLKGGVAVFLILVGFAEMAVPPFPSFVFAFPFGVAMAIVTLLIGLASVLFMLTIHMAPPGTLPKQLFTPQTRRLLKRAIFSIAIVAILVSSILLSAREMNFIREDSVANFKDKVTTNFLVNGTIASVALNHEVSNGFIYHVFPAYIKLNLMKIIWYENSSSMMSYRLPEQEIIVFCEKTDFPQLVVGQYVEIAGYYRPWMEDMLYSNMLLISANVDGSYLRAL